MRKLNATLSCLKLLFTWSCPLIVYGIPNAWVIDSLLFTQLENNCGNYFNSDIEISLQDL